MYLHTFSLWSKGSGMMEKYFVLLLILFLGITILSSLCVYGVKSIKSKRRHS